MSVEHGWSGSTARALEVDSAQPVTPSLVQAVHRLCDEAADAVLVLRLGGADEPSGRADLAIDVVGKWEQALRRLERVASATIAVVDGRCAGPALEVLLACDYRIGTPGSRLMLPLAAGEPWPGMVVYRLANQLGVATARQLVLFGAEITGRHAARLNLLDEVTDDPDGALAAQVELAGGVAGTELAIRRRLLLEAQGISFEDALGTHLAACDRVLRRTAAGVTP
ncbi:enoyl-CoA-hydratase DpgB [Umezawaea tangerina]|uniref:(3,5-dihydroxycyclohex-3-enyl)acetyl-CoA dehydratase subunit B n=1 Tax=Umezawaea tangerina TaxID=84725 RepID=A0A2T0T6K8_9PSEU|nr:enoyl-CoA-hydratase DpgB [Umezawaea tangerina]PRY41281.1 (3,5-dihydroxycyclohex-3-enyl)acetyl-CoA dehydratase subunit B [Umezawaea tangerina]